MHELIHHAHADGRHYPKCDCPIFNAFRRGLPRRIDSEVLWRADGSHTSAEYSSHPILDNGQVQGAVVTIVDITERKRAEAQLAQAREQLEKRVEERARIAREIHDELGSLLVALKMDVNWLEKRIDDKPPLQAKCHGMGGLIDRAVDNLGSILDHQGLWAALEWQAQEFIETTELRHELRVHVYAGVMTT